MCELPQKVKINICYEFKEGPWGGGNQFLKTFKNYLIKKDLYTENVKDADIILFNSHHMVSTVIMLKIKYPKKTFIHRLDGPIFYIRDKDQYKDKLIYAMNDLVADGSIFQSMFSYYKNIGLGYKKRKCEKIIYNAADSDIFNTKGKIKYGDKKIQCDGDKKIQCDRDKKIKLIATSWSPNMNKGFDTYVHLDKYLDFNRYQMTFVGNSPVSFKNIKMISPRSSKELAKILKRHDIFITASKKDPCSNSLIEAMQCGLICIGLDDGGHPEIIANKENIFKGKNDIIKVIDKVSKGKTYNNEIKKVDCFEEYYKFMEKVWRDKNYKKI